MALKAVGKSLGVAETFHATEVGVFFGDQPKMEKQKEVADPFFNGQGPKRTPCHGCGSCMIGCPTRAKNSLDKNYLYFAKKWGAQIFSETMANQIIPAESNGYLVKTIRSTRFFNNVGPTFVNANGQSKIMQEEIFGPIMPIIEIENLADAIEFINQRDKPLALYLFSDLAQEKNQLISNVSAGAICVNDTVMHLSSSYLPFGGVGGSGYGAYHGKFGFDLFSHHKPVLSRSFILDLLIKYPPYLEKLKNLRKLIRFSSWLT